MKVRSGGGFRAIQYTLKKGIEAGGVFETVSSDAITQCMQNMCTWYGWTERRNGK